MPTCSGSAPSARARAMPAKRKACARAPRAMPATRLRDAVRVRGRRARGRPPLDRGASGGQHPSRGVVVIRSPGRREVGKGTASPNVRRAPFFRLPLSSRLASAPDRILEKRTARCAIALLPRFPMRSPGSLDAAPSRAGMRRGSGGRGRHAVRRPIPARPRRPVVGGPARRPGISPAGLRWRGPARRSGRSRRAAGGCRARSRRHVRARTRRRSRCARPVRRPAR